MRENNGTLASGILGVVSLSYSTRGSAPGVIAPFPRPTPPVAQAERLWPYEHG